MRLIGLLGGMSCESTAIYYRLINEGVRRRLGGLHSAKILLHSFDFAEIQALQNSAGWAQAGEILASCGANLEKAGADCLLICANLMHRVEPQVAAAVKIPLLHIADVTGAALQRRNARRPLLLATRPVMEEQFYKVRLEERFELEVLVPDSGDRAAAHAIIFEELVRGIITERAKDRYLSIIARAQAEGADSVIFGCTEIGMLLARDDLSLPIFDTAVLHAQAAVDFALADASSLAA
ncbi:MAG: aspartate/glutamate racemase family protein [Hyphomicrobiales bacterium]|nr:aspartate/glutamate racemase family protein [Hyphomicrobiales bacterium]